MNSCELTKLNSKDKCRHLSRKQVCKLFSDRSYPSFIFYIDIHVCLWCMYYTFVFKWITCDFQNHTRFSFYKFVSTQLYPLL